MANQKFIRRVRNINGSVTITNKGQASDEYLPEVVSEKANRKPSDELDAYKMGIKNLAFLKQKVRDSVAREEQSRPVINLVEEKVIVKPKGFL